MSERFTSIYYYLLLGVVWLIGGGGLFLYYAAQGDVSLLSFVVAGLVVVAIAEMLSDILESNG